jgi:hypothetical protein
MLIQWVTLFFYAALAVLCLAAMWRYPFTRGMAAGWLVVALNTAALYLVAFLLWPERISSEATLVWSVATRIHVAFTAGWQIVALARGKL